MTKADLVNALEQKAKLPHSYSEKIINLIFRAMIQELLNDGRIEIRGLGSFANRNYKAYSGRNPKTGNIVNVAPKKVPFFKVGKELRERVDANKDKFIIKKA